MKIILVTVSGLFFAAVGAVVIGVILIFIGSPGTCVDRAISPAPSAAIAAQLDARWDLFSAESMAAPTSIEISESEATSRGRRYIDDEDAPIEDLRIYFCGDGKGQVAGKVEALGVSVDFVVTGHLDVSGSQPVVELDSVDVGSLPGFVSDAVLEALLDADTRTLELDENLTGSEIRDGVIIVAGGP